MAVDLATGARRGAGEAGGNLHARGFLVGLALLPPGVVWVDGGIFLLHSSAAQWLVGWFGVALLCTVQPQWQIKDSNQINLCSHAQ